VEDVLKAPVVATIANDYQGTNRAVAEGTWLDSKSEMGTQCIALADLLMEQRLDEKILAGSKKFLEHFSITPSPLVPTRR
jgi:hypothetical protein